VTAALRKATGVVAKAAGRGDDSSAATAAKTAKKTAAKKASDGRSVGKKAAPTKKAATKKAAAKKAPATKTALAKKAVAKKAVGKKAPVDTTVARKSAPAKTVAPSAKRAAAPKTKVAKKTTATSSKTHTTTAAATSAAPTKKAATKTTTAKKTATSGKLKVRDDESPWTAEELADVRAELKGDVERLTAELSEFENDIAGLIKDSGDGAGDDQADAGAKTFEREHEYSLAQNSRDLLEQSVHALERIDDGTYGVCENCGNAIGKLRLQAFPRATLCLTCKAQQERR